MWVGYWGPQGLPWKPNWICSLLIRPGSPGSLKNGWRLSLKRCAGRCRVALRADGLRHGGRSHCCPGYFFHYFSGPSLDCRVHYSSRVAVLQLSQGLKLGLRRGYERAPSGGELVLWSVVVFDRAAVIAPQRPRRVSTIKTSTSERDSLPKDRRTVQEEEDLRRARPEKAFIHFVLISFIYVGKLIPMSPLRSFWVHCPSSTVCFSLLAFLLGPAQIYFLFICVLKNMREAESRLGIPRGTVPRLSPAPLCTWRRVQRLLQFSAPLKRGVFRVIHSCDALPLGSWRGPVPKSGARSAGLLSLRINWHVMLYSHLLLSDSELAEFVSLDEHAHSPDWSL